MNHFESPFLAVSAGDWLCSNDPAFAIFDGFSVSPGHVLVTTRGIFETWLDASDEEQAHAATLQLRALHRALDRVDVKADEMPGIEARRRNALLLYLTKRFPGRTLTYPTALCIKHSPT